MTSEAEARQKWCFQTKRRSFFPFLRNADFGAGRLMRCLGRECMAWRSSPLAPDDGYCGLAGPLGVPDERNPRWPLFR